MERVNRKFSKLTLLPQAEAQGSTPCVFNFLIFRLRQYCQFLTSEIFSKTFFLKALVRAKVIATRAKS